MQLPTTDVVKKVLKEHQEILGLEKIQDVQIEPIGRGEANSNVLVTVNGDQRFNLRIGLRGEESERSLQSEFDILQIVPEGIGPRAYALDFERRLIPRPFTLLDYVTGELKSEWTQADFEAHARGLAKLHKRKFKLHGSASQRSEAPYDFVGRFDTAVDYWKQHYPGLLKLPIIAKLLPAIRQFIVSQVHLFDALDQFSVIHGDAHPLNILFDGGEVHYVDWEMAEIGDPASDIAMLGWDVKTAWQLELKGEQLDAFLDAYLKLLPDATMPQRRDVWMVYTMCFDQIYHRTQMEWDATDKNAFTVQQIETYLSGRFL